MRQRFAELLAKVIVGGIVLWGVFVAGNFYELDKAILVMLAGAVIYVWVTKALADHDDEFPADDPEIGEPAKRCPGSGRFASTGSSEATCGVCGVCGRATTAYQTASGRYRLMEHTFHEVNPN